VPLPFLPIDDVLPSLLDALRGGPSVVLQAPTGAGKTTRVPGALVDAGLMGAGRVVMLEPRRLAARAAAARMTAERGGTLGGEVGYQVRFDSRCGRDTRILVVTPGILLRQLQDNPFLDGIASIIFDEFHERGIDVDLALGIGRLIQQTVRPDLKLIVMSATLDGERIARYLGDCPIVSSAGRLFPVETHFRPRPPEQSWPFATAEAVRGLLKKTAGDVLVFLPGMAEIRKTAAELEPLAAEHDLAVLPLHGDLPLEQQDAALRSQPRRKVVLATNVAETSVTVEGVTGVVDTGLARQLLFDPAVGLDRLQVANISQASAEQRTGRAGRTGPGICVRLWSDVSHRSRPAQTEPEIRRVDVSGALLNLLSFGEKDPAGFPWLDAPGPAAVSLGMNLLTMLGAIDDNGLTALGKRMARLPVHPRLGRLLLAGQDEGCAGAIALAAALLSERDPFDRSRSVTLKAKEASESDLFDRVLALREFESSGRFQFPQGELHRGGAGMVLRGRDQLLRLLDAHADEMGTEEGFARALLAAYPDRLARRRNPGGNKGVMVGGRGVKLLHSSRVTDSELFLCIDVDAGNIEADVRLASGIRREWLPAERMREVTVVEFNPHSQKIEARRLRKVDDIILESAPVLLPDPVVTATILADAALANLKVVLPADDSDAGQYLLRLACLREWLPNLELPVFDGDGVRDLLLDLCATCRSFADLKKADWLQAIQNRLTWPQRQAVEREAPSDMEVPSGSRIMLAYERGRPPVLAVRIQELFGLTESPTVAGGRVKVLLHLLAPNSRPQQVTDDLASFWANTYPRIRGELRSRYPKHSWPEDPLTAVAMRGSKRRHSS